MNFLEYMFSSSMRLEDVEPRPARIIQSADAPAYVWASSPEDNSIVFQATPDLRRWAFYRMVRDQLAIVSPFGCALLPAEGLDRGREIGLVGLQPEGGAASWRIKVDDRWRDAHGEEAQPAALKARALPDGRHEPLHASVSFRGMDSKQDFWTIVLLPAPPGRIRSVGGAAEMEAGGRVFALPPGRASDEVVAGRVQWGLPNAEEFFELQDR